MRNECNQYFAIALRTFAMLVSQLNSSSVTLFAANIGTPRLILRYTYYECCQYLSILQLIIIIIIIIITIIIIIDGRGTR
jgi:hypothetical protein